MAVNERDAAAVEADQQAATTGEPAGTGPEPGNGGRPAGGGQAEQPTGGLTSHPGEDGRPAEEPPMPSLPEQISGQLGGWRGGIEAAIPVTVFIVVNMVWSLQPALAASVGLAILIAGTRLLQGRPVRYALNGLFGIGLGAFIAWRSGEARDFYLPGIWISYGYAAAMVVSVMVRHPLVGWLWSVLFAGGRSDWREDRRLMRTFVWLTLLWAVVWIVKVSVQAGLYVADQEHLLGVARLVLGAPPYALLLAITIWVVRRVQRTAPVSPGLGTASP